MRDYAVVRPRIWIQGTGLELRGDHEAREMVLYLMSAPGSNMLGLYYLPMSLVADELGYGTTSEARAVLQRVVDKGFAMYDDATRYVFVVNMAKEQIGERLKARDKRVLGIERELQKHQKCPFYNEFVRRYREAYGLRLMTLASTLVELPDDVTPALDLAGEQGPSEPPRSQDQDQEQEQDQEQRESARARAADEGRESTAPPATPPPPTPPPPVQRAQLELVRTEPEPEPARAVQREPEPEPPPAWSPPPQVDDEPGLAALRQTAHRVRVRFEQRYTPVRTVPPGWSSTNVAHTLVIAAWLSKTQGDPEVVLERLLDGFFADPWAVGHGYPLGALASDPGRYIAPPKPTPQPPKERRTGFLPPSPSSAYKGTDLNKLFARKVGGEVPCRS